MTVEKLERVMERIRKKHQSHEEIDRTIVYDAIMREIGTDNRTIYANIKALKRLKWLKASGKRTLIITGLDLEES